MNYQKTIKALTLLAILLGSFLFSFANNSQRTNPDHDQENYSIGETPDNDRISFIRNIEEEVNTTRVSLFVNDLSGNTWRFQFENANRNSRNFIRIEPIKTSKLYLQFRSILI
jgi:hypothetical protein